MKKTSRKMPTKQAIKDYWKQSLLEMGKFNSLNEIENLDCCFACTLERITERSHISARLLTMDDSVSNLHLLCKKCHKDSEYKGDNPIDLSDYWNWFHAMNLTKRLCIDGISAGLFSIEDASVFSSHVNSSPDIYKAFLSAFKGEAKMYRDGNQDNPNCWFGVIECEEEISYPVSEKTGQLSLF